MEERHSGGLLHCTLRTWCKFFEQTGNLPHFWPAILRPMQTLIHLVFANCTVAGLRYLNSIFTRYYLALNRSNSKFPQSLGLTMTLGGKKACLVFNRCVIQPDWSDRFVETGWPNGSFGALTPNSGSWSLCRVLSYE